MVERKPSRELRREPREGELTDLEGGAEHERVGVGKLTEGFREVEESDEDG